MKRTSISLSIIALLALAIPCLSAPPQIHSQQAQHIGIVQAPAPHAIIRQAAVHPVLVVWVGDYTDSSGTDHPNAVTFPASINIDQIGQAVGIQVYTFASAAAVQGVYAGKAYTPVGQHSYTIIKAQFPSMAAQPVTNGTVGSAIFGVVAQVAMTTQDVPTVSADGTPALDSTGKPVMHSFVQGMTMEYLDLVTGALTPYTGN